MNLKTYEPRAKRQEDPWDPANVGWVEYPWEDPLHLTGTKQRSCGWENPVTNLDG